MPPESSTLDNPNQRARTVDSDHIGMVKFSGRDNATYDAVKEDLQELAERPVPKIVPATSATSQFVVECIDSTN